MLKILAVRVEVRDLVEDDRLQVVRADHIAIHCRQLVHRDCKQFGIASGSYQVDRRRDATP